MAETLLFNLVSPERSLASLQVTEVRIPGADGDMTAMADHAPTITTLRPGVLTAVGPDGETKYVVTGGFAEIGDEGVSVLAERAVPAGDVTSEMLKGWINEATDAYSKAADLNKTDASHSPDDAAKLLADMVAIGDEISVGVN